MTELKQTGGKMAAKPPELSESKLNYIKKKNEAVNVAE